MQSECGMVDLLCGQTEVGQNGSVQFKGSVTGAPLQT